VGLPDFTGLVGFGLRAIEGTSRAARHGRFPVADRADPPMDRPQRPSTIYRVL